MILFCAHLWNRTTSGQVSICMPFSFRSTIPVPDAQNIRQTNNHVNLHAHRGVQDATSEIFKPYLFANFSAFTDFLFCAPPSSDCTLPNFGFITPCRISQGRRTRTATNRPKIYCATITPYLVGRGCVSTYACITRWHPLGSLLKILPCALGRPRTCIYV